MEMLPSSENERTQLQLSAMDGSHKYNVEQIKSDTREYIMYDYIFIKLKKLTSDARSQDGGYPEGGGTGRWHYQGVWGIGSILVPNLVADFSFLRMFHL